MVYMDGYSIGGQARHDANATASREWEEKLVGKKLGTKHDNEVSIGRLMSDSPAKGCERRSIRTICLDGGMMKVSRRAITSGSGKSHHHVSILQQETDTVLD